MSTQPQSRLATTIQWGLVAVVGLMSIHAFLSVWLGSLIGHQSIIQAWKEVLLLILSGATVALVLGEPARRSHSACGALLRRAVAEVPLVNAAAVNSAAVNAAAVNAAALNAAAMLLQ